jgi:hypothetical protein
VRPRWIPAAALLAYLGCVALSIELAVAKRRALAFDRMDYGFYAEFHLKLFDSDRAPRYALNPRGRNLFGYRGVEGARGLHQSVHLEPLKYLRAALATPWPGALPAHVFDALVFFSPVLYLALCMPRRDGRDAAFYAAAAAAWALLPSGQQSASFDLRPYALLWPLFCLSALSVTARRSRAEALWLFQALLWAREEALVLGLCVIAASRVNGRGAPFGWLLASEAAWLAAALAYFAWTGYERSASWIGVLGLLAAGAAAAAWIVPRLARASTWLPAALVALTGLALVPRAEDATLAELVYDPRHAPIAVCGLLAGVLAWPALRGRRARDGALAALAALALGFAAADLAAAPGSPRGLRHGLAARARDAAIVLEARRGLDPLATSVLCDYATCQAFVGFEHVYAFERLPWYVVPGDGRFYPENSAALRALIRERVDIVAVAAENLAALEGDVAAVGLTPAFASIAANPRFAVARIDRRPP